MTPKDKDQLTSIHAALVRAESEGDTQLLGSVVKTMVARDDFSQIVAEHREKLKWPPRSKTDLNEVVFLFLMMWLYRRDYEAAATLCWGNDPMNGVFTSEPWAVRSVWKAIKENRLINLLGAASMSKTYGPSAFFLLDWVLDPEWTLVRVMSTKEDHVKRNLFADIQRLYQNSAIKLPGKADSESIATETGKRAGQGIFILVIPRGSDASGTIKGSKVKPRPLHPLFGSSSRTRLLIDEAQEVPENAFDEIPNLYSSMEEDDIEHTKIVMAANPKDIFSRYGQNCIPVQGWDGIQTRDSEVDSWVSTTGWFCQRLNALKSENVVRRRTIYARFFTLNGYKMKLKAVGGDADHPLIWSEVYGMFPPNGTMSTIVQKHWVDRSMREWVFDSPTIAVGGEDPAFTGDAPAMSHLRVGHAVAFVTYDGQRHELKTPRWCIQWDSVGIMQRGDTQSLVDQTFDRAKVLSLRPQNFGIDRTGVGQGVHDIIRRQWYAKVDGVDTGAVADIVGIHFSESATSFKISEEDTKMPVDLYDGIKTEVWYAMAKYFEYDCIGISKGIPYSVIEQIVSRRGGSARGKGQKLTVESKDDYKARHGGKSPDEADSFTIAVHVARTTNQQLKPKAPDTYVAPQRQASAFGENSDFITIGEPLDMGFTMGADSEALTSPKD